MTLSEQERTVIVSISAEAYTVAGLVDSFCRQVALICDTATATITLTQNNPAERVMSAGGVMYRTSRQYTITIPGAMPLPEPEPEPAPEPEPEPEPEPTPEPEPEIPEPGVPDPEVTV